MRPVRTAASFPGRFVLLLLVSLAAACGPGGDDGENPGALTQGTITENEEGHAATADTYRAFSFATNGIGVVYLAPNPDTTCAGVKEYLTARGVYDPRGVLVSGKCSMAMRFKYDTNAGFDGVTITDADIGSFWNVNCAMGEGDWEIQGSGNDRDYQFTGENAWWWQGAAGTFSTTLSVGTDENTPNVDLNLGSDFTGQFIYDDTFADPATGSVTGTLEPERCQELVQTPLYGE
jgi:hypothetical protein